MGLEDPVAGEKITDNPNGAAANIGTDQTAPTSEGLHPHRPQRILRTAEELASKLPDHSEGLPAHLSIRELYLGNLNPTATAPSKVSIVLGDNAVFSYSGSGETVTATWNSPMWSEVPTQPEKMLFVPQLDDPLILGRNAELGGREIIGGYQPEMISTVVHRKEEGICAVSPIPDDLSYYPPMALQIPAVTEAEFVSFFSPLSVELECAPVPYCTFGVVVELKESGEDRDNRKILDRVVLAYPGGALLAEREIAPDGVPGDCSAAHWYETLRGLRTSPSRELLEAGERGFEVERVKYFVYPKQLAAWLGIGDDGSLLNADSSVFYDRMERILGLNGSIE